MKIALLSPFEECVPPEKYGGTELVVSNLAETLVSMGHEVHLLATGDSETKAVLHPVMERALRKESYAEDQSMRNAIKFVGISNVIKIMQDLDIEIIHNHIGWRYLPFSNHFKIPTLTTLHGPMNIGYQNILYNMFPEHPYISISNSQREPLPNLNYLSTVYNGIDLDKFDFSELQGEYLVFLGRMSPEKGPKQAIEIAKKFGMKLLMAAKIDSVDIGYYEKEIEPLIDGKNIIYLGEIGPAEKNELLGNAYALLAPIQWREPFGLFMIEAMACGTPVVATDMGSVSEILVEGETGYIVENKISNFVEALKKIPLISRFKCRQHVEKNFTKETMTKNYLNVYCSLIDKTNESRSNIYFKERRSGDFTH